MRDYVGMVLGGATPPNGVPEMMPGQGIVPAATFMPPRERQPVQPSLDQQRYRSRPMNRPQNFPSLGALGGGVK